MFLQQEAIYPRRWWDFLIEFSRAGVTIKLDAVYKN